jgi:hypothetical protein
MDETRNPMRHATTSQQELVLSRMQTMTPRQQEAMVRACLRILNGVPEARVRELFRQECVCKPARRGGE